MSGTPTVRGEIGARFREFRKELGLRQSALAATLGVPASSISEIERGRQKLSDVMLASLAAGYGLNVQWLLSGEGPMRGLAEHADHLQEDAESYVPATHNVRPGEAGASVAALIGGLAEAIRQAHLGNGDAAAVAAERALLRYYTEGKR